MKAAVRSVIITPPEGLPIGGNVRSDNIARGKHDDLLCNIIMLDNGAAKVCFLSFDLLGLHRDTCNSIKEAIFKKTGIKTDKIMISATHTHSGPDVLEIFKDGISSDCLEYLGRITAEVSDAVKAMQSEMFEAALYFSKDNIHDLSFNRRLFIKNGPMQMNWENIDMNNLIGEAGPIDPALGVISIFDSNGRTRGLIINFTLHPAVLVGKDWLWSSDYINQLRVSLKNYFGGDLTVLFANGAQGNINHLNIRDKNQGRGFEEADRIGGKLADYVIEAIQKEKEQVGEDIASKTKEIKLPLRQISEKQIKDAEKLLEESGGVIPSLLDGVPDEVYAREILKLSKIGSKYADTEIQAVKLGKDLLIASFPGEVFTEFGLKVKEKSGVKNTMIFGLTNDYIGYIPTQEAFGQGGYEIKTASSSKLDTMAGDMLVNEVLHLIKNI